MKYVLKNIRSFVADEDGVALTEYLVLLGILIGGVIVAVTAASVNLASAWSSWGTFWTTTVSYTAPAAP